MAWKMIEKPKTILASASLAKEFVDMEAAPYDRPLSERRLQIYERILKAGAFRPVVWASAVCYETNCTYRVNGKHTSILISRQNPIPPFYVTVERWGCDTLRDVSSLYNTFDSNISNRSASDINHSFAAAIPELREVPIKFINLTVSAAALLKWSDRDLRHVSQAERAEELLDRAHFIGWLRDVVGSSDTHMDRGSAKTANLTKHLLRTAVVQAMMATYDKAPKVAAEFWRMVKDESAPDRDHPTRVLARFLVRAVIAGGRGTTSKESKAVGYRELFVRCIRAWNAYRSNESTTLQYRASDPLPTVSK